MRNFIEIVDLDGTRLLVPVKKINTLRELDAAERTTFTHANAFLSWKGWRVFTKDTYDHLVKAIEEATAISDKPISFIRNYGQDGPD